MSNSEMVQACRSMIPGTDIFIYGPVAMEWSREVGIQERWCQWNSEPASAFLIQHAVEPSQGPQTSCLTA